MHECAGCVQRCELALCGVFHTSTTWSAYWYCGTTSSKCFSIKWFNASILSILCLLVWIVNINAPLVLQPWLRLAVMIMADIRQNSLKLQHYPCLRMTMMKHLRASFHILSSLMLWLLWLLYCVSIIPVHLLPKIHGNWMCLEIGRMCHCGVAEHIECSTSLFWQVCGYWSFFKRFAYHWQLAAQLMFGY